MIKRSLMSTAAPQAIRFASRVHAIQESPTLAVMNRAASLMASGVDVVDFGPGEPDFGTPKNVGDAGKRAIDEGFTKYTNASGTKVLREAIANRYNRLYGTHAAFENVIAGSGGKQELFNLMLALIEEGDEVIIPIPYWVSFPDQVAFAGGKPVFARTSLENNLRPRFSDIEAVATDRTRAVIINSPANPSGAVIAESELTRIVEWCVAHDAFLIFDETYELFVYEGSRHTSAMAWFDRHPENIVVVNSMSKTYAMTGWRIGYAVAHKEIITALGKIQSHSTSNPSSIAQVAALEAITGDDADVRKMFDAYRERRAWLVPALNAIEGMCCAEPDGAFYVFPDISGFFGRGPVHDSTSFASFLLDEARVAVVPGAAFGMEEGVRISYATSMERIREGVARIEAAVKKL
ncbi:MAG TPA: pyridoxal phosphate-dependent aminotransferase [Thermoanaerobaculia bacterium]|nr:pyridoxal phosphate-dependent aminotransferase [Thermoanaerobaculia bacterium]